MQPVLHSHHLPTEAHQTAGHRWQFTGLQPQVAAKLGAKNSQAVCFCFVLFLHCLTSGLWSITEPSPDAPATKGRRLAFVVDRALAAELLSALA